MAFQPRKTVALVIELKLFQTLEVPRIQEQMGSNNAVSTWQKPRNALPSASTSNSRKTDPNNSSQNTPLENIPAMAMDVEENPSHVSPEVSKSMTHKRFKFSPGMALDPERPVIFIDTDMLSAFEAKGHKTVNNPVEACIISQVAEELVHNGIEEEDIGIITPYNSQANLIRHTVSTTSVEINTIDKYQGRDKGCILVSFARSSENPRNCTSSLLGDWHRINVALTRAKKKLIVVGSFRTLSKVPLLKLLIEKVEEQSG